MKPGKYAVDFVLNEKWTASILRRPKNLAKRLKLRLFQTLVTNLLNLTFDFERTIAYPTLRPPDRSNLSRLRVNRKLNLHRISRATRWSCARIWTLLFLFSMVSGVADVVAQNIEFGRPDTSHPVNTSAESIEYWEQGKMQVLHLHGPVRITQGNIVATANDAILFVERTDTAEALNEFPVANAFSGSADGTRKVIAYLEGNVVIDIARTDNDGTPLPSDRIVDDVWLGRFITQTKVGLNVEPMASKPNPPPLVFQRAMAAIDDGARSTIQQVALQQSVISPLTGQIQTIPQDVPGVPSVPDLNFEGTLEPVLPVRPAPVPDRAIAPQPPVRVRGGQSRVNFYPRDSKVDFNLKIVPNPALPGEQTVVGTGGVKVVVDDPGVEAIGIPGQPQGERVRQVVILADSVIGWNNTRADGQSGNEIYLEGNIVFAQGSRVIYADQMYYDVNTNRGTIFNADMLTPAGQYNGLVRLKADVIQQVNENNLQAYGSAFTSSRLGLPRYWLQSEAIGITRNQTQAYDPNTGQPLFNPQTGQPELEEQYFAEAQSNAVYLGGIPTFYWPRFRTNLSDPSPYLTRFRIGNDRAFGTRIETAWNLYQLLGVRNAPENATWIGRLDWLSDRGVGFGSELDYQFRDGLFGIPGNVNGFYRSWFINDDGLDTLGRDRGDLVPEESLRGRILGRHRHQFAPGFSLRAELGYISDRNFLEQFYEQEWDNDKDFDTGIWLERNIGVQSFNLTANFQLNDFHTQTSWLPRFDHFTLGQRLGRFTWNTHSHAGYARFRVADPPIAAVEQATFDPLAWEQNDADGIRAGTRQEISLPIQTARGKIVPYVLGDVTYWQEDINGDDLLRGFVQTGIRASNSIWKIDPTIQSTLWNVNGLAHKVTFDADLYFADSSQDLDQLPLYDALDDDAQESFRRRFAFDTFGILPGEDVPLQFDERFFALRSGLQRNVTSPSAEIADDQVAVRLGARQRWQTKRGLPGDERIIDWITLDSEVTYFADPNEDNFGQGFGQFNYDFRWHLGDRFSIVSDGYFDFFGDGLRTASIGGVITRPDVGNLRLGFRSIEGPISSNIVSANATYRLSDKWGLTANTAFDFGDSGRLGQAINFIYIGESFLWRLGFNADFSRDNVGFQFGFEPRFTSGGRLFRPGGLPIGPASSRWLE